MKYIHIAVTALLSIQAFAQPPGYVGNPDSSRQLPKPSFRSPAPLPEVTPLPPEEKRISAGVRVFVASYRFSGNTVFSEEALARVAKPYAGRVVNSEDLEELRHKLTLLYVSRGYINSGALLPDQDISDHVVRFQIVEGKLDRINVAGSERLKASYVSDRLFLGAAPPLELNSLQERLLLLQEQGLIEKINAELSPGETPGSSELNVLVKEAPPFQAGLTLSNHYSPSVGAYHLDFYAAHKDLSGRGDLLEAKYGLAQGINDYFLHYALPIDPQDDKVGFRVSQNDSAVIEAPFSQLNIASRSQTTGLDFSHPLIQTPAKSLNLGFAIETRKSQTYLLGIPFSFTAGVVDGRSEETVFRFSQEWTERAASEALTLRSTLSMGTTNALPKAAGIGPDKHFLSWLAQGQWARRLDEKGRELILLSNLQWSPQTLLTLEKLGLGGANSVRGYRETQLLRDNGFVLSCEYRIPIFFDRSGTSRTQFAPFVDYGKGWNSDPTPDLPRDIASIGLGILWNPDKKWQAQLYAGQGFRRFQNPGSHDLQDLGIHFMIDYKMF